MQRESDRNYFRERAEAELASARAAKTPEAQRAHSVLAGYYFDRAFSDADEAAEAPNRVLNEIQA
jgi:hypothetical protein